MAKKVIADSWESSKLNNGNTHLQIDFKCPFCGYYSAACNVLEESEFSGVGIIWCCCERCEDYSEVELPGFCDNKELASKMNIEENDDNSNNEEINMSYADLLVAFYNRACDLWGEDEVEDELEQSGDSSENYQPECLAGMAQEKILNQFQAFVYIIVNELGGGDYVSMRYELKNLGVDLETIDYLLSL